MTVTMWQSAPRRVIWLLVGFWSIFAGLDLAQTLRFVLDTGNEVSWLRTVVRTVWVYGPWLAFSLWLAARVEQPPWKLPAALLRHLVTAGVAAATHIALLTASFWVFYADRLGGRGFGSVYLEQALSKFHFELLVYAAVLAICVLGRRSMFNRRVPEKIPLKDSGRTFWVRPEEIEWLEACDNYVAVHLGDRTHVVRDTLRHMEQRLRERGFLRVHRSALVNLNRVRQLDDEALQTESGDTVPVSRRRRTLLRDRMPSTP